MIAKPHEFGARDAASGQYRLFLFFGPDESASRMLVARVAAALGDDVERIELSSADLKDKARLADEAAAFGMFGSKRLILCERVGEDHLAAVEAVLDAPGGNLVILLAGDLKKGSKLRKLVEGHREALALACYELDAKSGTEVEEMARPLGLRLERGIAHRLIEDVGGSRGLVEQELAKLALYLDGSPEAPRLLDQAAIDAVGAGAESGVDRLVDAVVRGDLPGIEQELARLRAEGGDGVMMLRAAERRLVTLARIQAEMAAGRPAKLAAQMCGVFWKEQDAYAADARRWPPALLARALGRLLSTELGLMEKAGAGQVAAEAELFAIGRQAARRR